MACAARGWPLFLQLGEDTLLERQWGDPGEKTLWRFPASAKTRPWYSVLISRASFRASRSIWEYWAGELRSRFVPTRKSWIVARIVLQGPGIESISLTSKAMITTCAPLLYMQATHLYLPRPHVPQLECVGSTQHHKILHLKAHSHHCLVVSIKNQSGLPCSQVLHNDHFRGFPSHASAVPLLTGSVDLFR